MTDPVWPDPARPDAPLRLVPAAIFVAAFVILFVSLYLIRSETLALQGFRAGSGHAGSPLFGAPAILPETSNQKANP